MGRIDMKRAAKNVHFADLRSGWQLTCSKLWQKRPVITFSYDMG